MEQSIAIVVRNLYSIDVAVELNRPDAQHGDYSTNVALKIAKEVGKSPRDISQELKNHLVVSSESINRVDAAGPGFLNIFISDQALLEQAFKPVLPSHEGKVVVTEYSDMNPFKQSHVGHLYTTIVGDVISRLYEAAGATVHRVNFGGDVGLHVAKTMWGIIQSLDGENPAGLDEVSKNSRERTVWLSERYIEGNLAYEGDETAKESIISINQRVYELHDKDDHDSDFAQIYWTCRRWSYDYFKDFYDLLQVTQFEKYYPESATAPMGVSAVRQQLAKGVYKESDGAVVFDGEKYGLHTRVFINSKGLPTYETKDVGLSMLKWQDYHFDESVIVTGNDIQEYMKVVIKSIEQFEPKLASRTKHITHGNVKLAGGVKMSSRLGNGLAPEDVIESAREASKTLTNKVDENVVIGAVKYAFLRSRIGGDLIYDAKESVSIEGNSGPYIQYAHARARSILAKASWTETEQEGGYQLGLEERALVRKMTEFAEVISKSTQELMPHHICVYLYELAQEFNRFYEKNRVLGSEQESERLRLVGRYADILAEGLKLLGIHAPERM